MIDFVAYINQEATNLTPQQKANMLSYFCKSFRKDLDTVQKQKDFMNDVITKFLKERVRLGEYQEKQDAIQVADLNI